MTLKQLQWMQQMKEQHSDYHNAEWIRPTNKYKYPIQRKHTTEVMDISCTTPPQSINKNNQTKTKKLVAYSKW